MPPGDDAARVLARLESALDSAPLGGGRTVFAFSGGLGSLILAALLRKRVELDCVVVASGESRDLADALLAERFLDYRVTPLRLAPSRAQSMARSIGATGPGLSLPAILSLVPLRAVLDARPRGTVVAGYGFHHGQGTATLRAAHRVRLPWLTVSGGLGLPRERAVRLARSLGLPDAFARVRPRSPAVGSGVDRALRELARRKKTRVAALVRAVPGASRINRRA